MQDDQYRYRKMLDEVSVMVAIVI